MIKKVVKAVTEDSLLRPGDTVIVAVSGGVDSVALLDVLISLEQLSLILIVAHLNHGLRGCDSDEDERFVARLAADHDLPFESLGVDVAALSTRRKLNLEEAGRFARYDFLHSLQQKYAADAVALGHHADDQAETVLMRLLRGAATTGLAAMAPKTGRLIRPLLGVSRVEIEQYAAERGLEFREDSSNTDTTFLRNRIRHELLPYLATYNPAIATRLAATAQVLAADEAMLQEATESSFGRHGRVHGGIAMLSVAGVTAEPVGLRYRLFRRALLHVRGNLGRLGFRHLQAIDRLMLAKQPNSSLDLPGGCRVFRNYDSLTFSTSVSGSQTCMPEVVIPRTGSYPLAGGGVLRIEEAPVHVETSPDPRVAFFDGDQAPFPWVVRGFRPGDRMIPLGMSGRKKVKDLFMERRIPREKRCGFPLLFSGDRLMWVCSLRVSAETRVTDTTSRLLRAEILDFTPCIDL